MPKKYFEDEEDENIQQWTPIIIKKDPIIKKDDT